jgi:hypothetical protein
MRWLLAVPIAALVVLGGVNSVSAARAGQPQRDISSAVHAVGPAVEAALPEGRGDVVVRTASFEADVYLSGLVLYLEGRGTAVRVDRSRKDEYGVHRVHARDEPQRASLILAADQSFDEMSTRPDLRLVAYWGTRAREARARLVSRQTDLQAAYDNGTLDFDAYKRRLASLHPGSAVGVFMTSSAQQ